MGSAFHQLCPRYSGTLTPTAPTAIRLWDTFTFPIGRCFVTREQILHILIRQSDLGQYLHSNTHNDYLGHDGTSWIKML